LTAQDSSLTLRPWRIPLSVKRPVERLSTASRVAGAAIGLPIAGVVLLVSVFLFRMDSPILWPPPGETVLKVFYGLVGTAFLVALLAMVWLAVCIVAALAGRSSWQTVTNSLVQILITTALVVGSVWVSLTVFYWPWAVECAVWTVEANPPPAKWRLLSSARLLAARSADEWKGRLVETDEDQLEVRVAICFARARTGEREALMRFVELAMQLPPGEGLPDEPEKTPISKRDDALWLFGKITDGRYETLEDFAGGIGEASGGLAWDARTGRYTTISR